MTTKPRISSWLHAGALGIPAATLVLLLAGCARTAKPCPVAGQLLVNGKPAEGAYVVFHAIDDPKRQQSPAATTTQKDGAFTTRVRGRGEYAVTVFWPAITEEEGDVIEGEDQFMGKFRDPQQPVLRVTIQDGENSLPPIELTFP